MEKIISQTAAELVKEIAKQNGEVQVKVKCPWKNNSIITTVDSIIYDKRRAELEENQFEMRLSGLYVALADYDFCNVFPIEAIEEIKR